MDSHHMVIAEDPLGRNVPGCVNGGTAVLGDAKFG